MPGALPGAGELGGEKEEDIKMNTHSQTPAARSSPETLEGMDTVYPKTVVATGTRMLEAGLPAVTSLAVEEMDVRGPSLWILFLIKEEKT